MECTNIDVNCQKKGIILSYAIQSHRIEMFKILLEKSQHDINEKYISIFFFNYDEITILYFNNDKQTSCLKDAFDYGDEVIAEFILNYPGFDINKIDVYYYYYFLI